MRKSGARGFTFVEVLVAMMVLGVLSAIAIPRYRAYKERAYLATMRTDLGHVRLAQEAHFAEHLQYATDTTALDFRTTSSVRVALSSGNRSGGYTAVATHVAMPGQQCATFVGQEANNRINGAIICGPAPSGSGTLAP
jgi:prepilin-type N-terminal cleavage/methylation domain-containing protein